jgi:hypothetical protein
MEQGKEKAHRAKKAAKRGQWSGVWLLVVMVVNNMFSLIELCYYLRAILIKSSQKSQNQPKTVSFCKIALFFAFGVS